MQHINANLQASMGSSFSKHKTQNILHAPRKSVIVYVKSAVCFFELFTENSLQLPWSKELP
jgi:hypothetical protein